MKRNNNTKQKPLSEQATAQEATVIETVAMTPASAPVAIEASNENEAIEAAKAQSDLVISRDPVEVLAEAQKAAQALKDVISSKPHKVMFNGEQYLEFEDWQTLAKFYGITVKCVSTQYVEFGSVRGFEARAEALRVINGQVISGAEAMCLNDERNWSNKPLFQLKSMAQTRACAKALRNVLAWVVVLAGYKPTPAEEMTGLEGLQRQENKAAAESQAKAAVTSEKKGEPDEIVQRFLKINEDYSQVYGPEGYKYYLRNSKGESPTIERIRNFSTPKQLAWLRTAVAAMEEELKWVRQ